MKPSRGRFAVTPRWRLWLLAWLLPALLWAQHAGLAHRVAHAGGHDTRAVRVLVAAEAETPAAGVLAAHDHDLCTLLDHIGTGDALVAHAPAISRAAAPALGDGVRAPDHRARASAPYAARAPPGMG